MPLPAGLVAAAAPHRGVLTRRTLLEHGCGDRQIRGWVAGGELRALWRGVFTLAPAPLDAEGRHRERAYAVGTAYAGRLAVSHHSALVLAGLPVHAVDLDTARFVRRNQGDSLRVPGIRVSRSRIDLPTCEVDGAPVVHEAVALAQVAAESGVEAAVVAGDAALHRGSVALDQLEAAVRLVDLIRPAPCARQLPTLVDARSESPGESLLRLIATRAGIALEPQHVVRDASGVFVARCDFRLVGAERVLVEFDGKVKYDDRNALFAEKRREDALRRLGWSVLRFVWADLAAADAVVRRLRNAARG